MKMFQGSFLTVIAIAIPILIGVISLVVFLISPLSDSLYESKTESTSVAEPAQNASKMHEVSATRYEISGIISYVDEQNKFIVITSSSTGESRKVHIDYDTKIVVTIPYVVPMTETREKTYSVLEINVADLRVGSLVNIGYWVDSHEIKEVDEIYVGEASPVGLELVYPKEKLFGYKIISFADDTKILAYEIPSFINGSSSIAHLTISNDVNLFVVSDSSRAGIVHARVPATVEDIVSGAIMLPVYETGSTNQNKKIKAIIISK